MKRDQAIALAIKCAMTKPHPYMSAYAGGPPSPEQFKPHEWVIDAILMAANAPTTIPAAHPIGRIDGPTPVIPYAHFVRLRDLTSADVGMMLHAAWGPDKGDSFGAPS